MYYCFSTPSTKNGWTWTEGKLTRATRDWVSGLWSDAEDCELCGLKMLLQLLALNERRGPPASIGDGNIEGCGVQAARATAETDWLRRWDCEFLRHREMWRRNVEWRGPRSCCTAATSHQCASSFKQIDVLVYIGDRIDRCGELMQLSAVSSFKTKIIKC